MMIRPRFRGLATFRRDDSGVLQPLSIGDELSIAKGMTIRVLRDLAVPLKSVTPTRAVGIIEGHGVVLVRR